MPAPFMRWVLERFSYRCSRPPERVAVRQRADVSLRGPSSSDRKNVVPFELLSLRAGPTHSWHRSDQQARLGVPRGGGVTDQQTGATASLHDVFPALPPVRLT